MSSRGYQQHNLIVANDSQYSWGGSDYSLLALKSGTTVPDGLSTNVRTGETRNSQVSITGATFTKDFIIPTVFDAVSIIDGTIEGTIKLAAFDDSTGGASDYCEVVKAELTINAIDSSGSSTTIAAKQEIWSGQIRSTHQDLVTAQVMYWIDVRRAIVNANERIVLEYTITYNTVDQFENENMAAYIYCTIDTDETTITIPFVM